MKVRVFQPSRDVKQFGRKAAWHIEWRDPKTEQKFSKRIGPKKLADEAAAEKLAELTRSEFGMVVRKPWSEFVGQYQRDCASRWRSDRSREESKRVLEGFGQSMKPKFCDSVTPAMLDGYVGKRLQDRGAKKGDTLSAESVRKELRTIRAALGQARKWNYLRTVPEMPTVKALEVDKRHISEQHFDAMLTALDQEQSPVSYPFAGDYGDGDWTAADWWAALLMFLWCTGMRIGAVLALKWADVDVEAGIARSRARDNKQKRDHVVHIGPVVELLKRIKGAHPNVFPWNHAKTHLADEYRKLQKAASIDLPCDGEGRHECTDACHRYCFHDFRRAHATGNLEAVGAERLQRQMGHASFSTTRRYVDYAKKHQESTYDVHLPKLAKAKSQGLKLTGQAEPQDGGQAADRARNQSSSGGEPMTVSA